MQPHEFVILEIARERERQIASEGWTEAHDDQHINGEMAGAAACYTLQATKHWMSGAATIVRLWPWDTAWWKPTDARRDLVKAGALIVAEIERLDRASKSKA